MKKLFLVLALVVGCADVDDDCGEESSADAGVPAVVASPVPRGAVILPWKNPDAGVSRCAE